MISWCPLETQAPHVARDEKYGLWTADTLEYVDWIARIAAPFAVKSLKQSST
jgi:hypothetical protein